MKSQRIHPRPTVRRVRFVTPAAPATAPKQVVKAPRRRMLPFAGVTVLVLAAASVALFGFTSRKPILHIEAALTNIPFQTFAMDASKGDVIHGEQGAIFAFPENAFVDELGNAIAGKVTLRIKEAHQMKDILKGNLTTRTDGAMLATDGMYYLEASQNGKAVKLNPAVGVYAYFPTKQKDGDMGLYAGDTDGKGLNWKLLGNNERTIPQCDRDAESRKQCKRCEKLAKMTSKIKTTKAPTSYEQFFEDRYYWQNGKLYFASSGSAKALFTEDELRECEEYLKATEKGQELLAKVEKIKQDQVDKAQDYYAYRLQGMGWYNIDKLVKEELITFRGKVTDKKGRLIPGAQVHLLCTDSSSRIHTTDVAEDGTFELQFAPGKEFRLYVYQGARAGKAVITLDKGQQDVGAVAVADMDLEQLDKMLNEVM